MVHTCSLNISTYISYLHGALCNQPFVTRWLTWKETKVLTFGDHGSEHITSFFLTSTTAWSERGMCHRVTVR